MERLKSDLMHALRRLGRAPAFASIAILTLALGIGANTAIFSLVRGVVLRPLPYGDPDRLMMIWGTSDKGETTWLAAPEIRDYRGEHRTFESVAAYYGSAANLTGGLEPERVVAALVTPNLFQTLRVRAHIGRTFEPTASAATIADQVVLGYGLWQRRFGGRADVVGQSIQVNGRARTVIGVMPPDFRLPRDFSETRPSELWTPYDMTANADNWSDHSLIGFARLTAGTTAAQATSVMRLVESRWVRDGHWNNKDAAGRAAVPIKDLVLGDVRFALWILFGAVGVILLIACANVANLTLARADDRHREVAVRTALGASRGHIVRQLLTESVLLAVIGGVAGVLVALGGMKLLLALRPTAIPRLELTQIDAGVLAFTLAITVVTGLLFGLAPALELSRPDLNRSLKEGGRTGSVGRSQQRFRDSLAITQMAMSVVLLIGAVLLIRSFMQLRSIDVGFRTERALTARVVLPLAGYPTDTPVTAFYRTLRQRLAELPGVQSVGGTRLLPLTGTIGDWSITLEGKPTLPGENPNGDWQVVTPGYFETMGVRLVRGRFMTDADHESAPLVAVINETMAKRYWPDEDAIGKRFHLGTNDRPWITIVGIIGQIRHNAVTETPRAEMYVAHAQWGPAGASAPRGMTFVLRTAGDPMAALGYVKQTVRALDPNVPVADVRTLEAVASASLAQARFTTTLLGLFAALALTLATIGIYGVISLLVTRRRQEIGIRIALGARRTSIVGMVLQRGLVLASVGVVVGLGAALLLARVMQSLLYGVSPFDGTTFAVVPLLLGTVAVLACMIPARRAATVNPVVALRDE
jgi:putative ABC transport system permease protein